MAPSADLKALLDEMPNADGRGMYCTDIDKDRIEAAVAKIHEGGRANVLAIIDMLTEPGQGDDLKPHYALHCLALRVCNLKHAQNDDTPRRDFALALASQVGGNRPKGVQKYLVQELQTAGGPEVVDTLGKLLADEDLCEPAARALIAIGPGAADHLRQALPRARGKARVTLIQNLGVLREAKVAAALREAVTDADPAVRIAAGWALANIGDAGAVDLLLAASKRAAGWERTQMTKACLLLAERLRGATGQAAAT